MLTIVVSGSRDYTNYPQFKSGMEIVISEWQYKLGLSKLEMILFHGGAKGTDLMADRWAKENGIEIKSFPADWKDFSNPCIRKFKGDYEYNAMAGVKRNEKMIKEAIKSENIVFIAFWKNESKGTLNAIELAEKYKIANIVIFKP